MLGCLPGASVCYDQLKSLFFSVCFLPVFALVMTFLSGGESFAAERYSPRAPLQIADDLQRSSIMLNGAYIDDVDRNLSIEDLIEYFYSYDVKYHEYESLSLGIQFDRRIWIHFSVENNTKHDQKWILNFDNPQLDLIDVYKVKGSKIVNYNRYGDEINWNERKIKYRFLQVTESLIAGSKADYYVRIKMSSAMIVPIFASSPEGNTAFYTEQDFRAGLFYGMVLSISLYHFALFIFTGMKDYLYYSLFTTFIALFHGAMDGLLFPFWPDYYVWQERCVFLFLFSGGLFATLFYRSYLKLDVDHPLLDRGSKVIVSVYIVSILALPFLSISSIANLNAVLTTVLVTFAFSVGLYKGFRREEVAYYFIVAWGPNFIVVYWSFFAIFIGGDYVYYDALFYLKCSHAFQVIFLSIGLAKIVTQLKFEKNQSDKLAYAAEIESETKSSFLAKMSHEIRTPMNGVLGVADLLRQTKLDETQTKYVRTIYKSGEALLGIINDILDYSKIEAGKMEFESVPLNLHELLNESLSVFAIRAHQEGIETVLSFKPGTPINIKSDPTRLRQIVLNYLSNAFKFTENGSVVLKASFDGESQIGRPMLKVEVTDSGVGMTEEQMDKLFKNFSQVHSSAGQQYGGTGLGLVICKQLAELMHGTVGVSSAPGVGTTFWFKIPVDECLLDELPISFGCVDLTGCKILVVDDCEVFLEVMSEELISQGLEVYTANSAPVALEKLRGAVSIDKPFDLISIDMDMPIMNGMQLAKVIAGDSIIKNVQRMLLTSHKILPSNNELKEVGLSFSLEKPVSSSNLSIALSRLYQSATQSKNVFKPLEIEVPNFSGYKVLVAEDNAVNQLVITGMLNKMNLAHDVVNDGEEALTLYRRRHSTYDLVLMDCEMPNMDGLQAAKAIRSFEAEQGLPTIGIAALTAHAMIEHQQLCSQAGMTDFLAKPINMKKLVELISKSFES